MYILCFKPTYQFYLVKYKYISDNTFNFSENVRKRK